MIASGGLLVTSNDGIRNAKKRSVISSEGDMLVQHVGIVTQVGLDTDEKAGDFISLKSGSWS